MILYLWVVVMAIAVPGNNPTTRVMPFKPAAESENIVSGFDTVDIAELRKNLIGKKIQVVKGKHVDGTDFLVYPRESKITILNFCFTKCPSCSVEMKALENLVALRESGELAVVSITSDMSSILQEFIQQNNIKIDMMIDRNASIKRELGLPFVVPIDVFVARDGTVIDVVVSGSKATDGSVDSLTNSFLKILDSVAESQSVR